VCESREPAHFYGVLTFICKPLDLTDQLQDAGFVLDQDEIAYFMHQYAVQNNIYTSPNPY